MSEPYFDAAEFWRNKPNKCFVVCLSKGEGKKARTSFFNVQAKNEDRAIHVAKLHCLWKGKIHGSARLATPRDLGAR